MHNYGPIMEQSDGSFAVLQHREDGLTRPVSLQHIDYLAWLEAGNPAPATVPFVMPAPSLDEAKALLIHRVNELRKAKEQGGINFAGMLVSTDRDSQAMLNGALEFFSLNPGVSEVSWRVSAGQWITLAPSQVMALSVAVGQHVQACFTAQKVHEDAILVLPTVEATRAYDIETGWPA